MKQKQKPTKETVKTLVSLADDPELKALVEKAKTGNFLSSKELKLTEKQYDSLVATLLLMETGGVVHIKEDNYENRWEGKKLPEGKSHFFNMSAWREKSACGSVCCLGGTAELLAGEPVFRRGAIPDKKPEIDKLFYPYEIKDWDTITPKRAANVLRNYLETGVTKW